MTQPVKNILFIMCDQLRWDYLSCTGHPHLKTPNIDSLAARGVRFDRAYVQSPVCGPSRACFYTGRTVFSHGVTWNRLPLPIGEMAIGDYLRPHGITTAVVGKTHQFGDPEAMERLGLTPETEVGMLVAHPGFDPYERDDGLHPNALMKKKGGKLAYNDWLRSKGYDSPNPWNDFANAAEGPDGEVLSAWNLRHSDKPARVDKAHSETAYMTLRAREFITQMGDQPWLCHLSYIKPHWPYIAPAPYHAMYGPEQMTDIHRDPAQRDDPNPVYGAFTNMEVSQTFSQEGVRETVLTGYMGLIKEIDDHLGELFAWLDAQGKTEDTMIVFTSDHGDYLGDHWMGEKELFHECSVRVPLIIVDPRAQADATRGTVSDAFVEAIDLVPTFLDATGVEASRHRLEGQSLMPLLHGDSQPQPRTSVFSEIDYAFYDAAKQLDVDVSEARGYMIRTKRWKYIYFRDFPPQLFDLENDPNEFRDLGQQTDSASIRAELHELLFQRILRRKNRITTSDADVKRTRELEDESGIIIGRW